MAYLKSFCIALSTFSAIPVPQFEPDENSLARSLCFLPVVGLIIAVAEFLWLKLCWLTAFNLILRSAVAAALPLIITGGIHMDGFCDTVDAICSHQDTERSLEIMKDSRAGAFAVIFCGLYLLLNFGLASEASEVVLPFCTVYVMSRAIAVLSIASYENAREEGMLAKFQKSDQQKLQRVTAWCWIVLCGFAMDFYDIWAGSGALLACVVTWHAYHRTAMRRFCGITGDTSGFFVQVLELAMLAGIVLGGAAKILWSYY